MSSPGDRSVTQILVGRQIIGLVGLREAFLRAEDAGLTDRGPVVDHLLATLSEKNYVPDTPGSDYRIALWREFVRHQGGDIREFYSDLDVVVLGPPDRDRETFVDTLRSVLADYELKPAIAHGPPDGDGPYPRLLIDGETVIRGVTTRRALKQAIRKRISHW